MSTYTIEMKVHRAVRIDGGCFAAERDDFAEDAHRLVDEGFEVLGIDTGSGFGGHGEYCF